MTKKVKAFAIVRKGKIENADYFSDNQCCNYEPTQALAIYETLDEAETMMHSLLYKVIPCTISFTIPKKKRV